MSAVANPAPLRVRRNTAKARSISGTPRINSGITSGAKKNQDCPVNESSLCPPTAIVDEAINSPSNSAPLSPMKIFAGWKFQNRNPRHTPTVTTATSGPTLPANRAPSASSLTEYNRNAPEAMAITPAANPSRPSIRLTALAISSTQHTLTRVARSGDNTVKPSSGIGTLMIDTPLNARIDPASTMPATFAGGDTSRMSSTSPVAKITVAAIATPTMFDGDSNTDSNSPSNAAHANPARRPRYIAPPPSDGVGCA